MEEENQLTLYESLISLEVNKARSEAGREKHSQASENLEKALGDCTLDLPRIDELARSYANRLREIQKDLMNRKGIFSDIKLHKYIPEDYFGEDNMEECKELVKTLGMQDQDALSVQNLIDITEERFMLKLGSSLYTLIPIDLRSELIKGGALGALYGILGGLIYSAFSQDPVEVGAVGLGLSALTLAYHSLIGPRKELKNPFGKVASKLEERATYIKENLPRIEGSYEE